jgi:hypothetical protein
MSAQSVHIFPFKAPKELNYYIFTFSNFTVVMYSLVACTCHATITAPLEPRGLPGPQRLILDLL